MDNRFQATFMPRQAVVPGTGDAYARPKTPPNFLMIVGVLVFILVALALGGLFLYRSYVKASNEDKQARVEEAIKNFEPELTKELTVIKARMDAGKFLLENHKAVSLLFALLEANTAQTVRFSELTYTVNSDKKIDLTMKGEARTYHAIAFQSDVFSKLDSLKNPMFSNLAIDLKGMISFNVKAELDPSAVSYKKLVQGFVPPAEVTATTTPVSATTTPGSTVPSSTTTPPVTTQPAT